MKKDRLQGLIKEEKFMLGQLKDESLVNHKTANALKVIFVLLKPNRNTEMVEKKNCEISRINKTL